MTNEVFNLSRADALVVIRAWQSAFVPRGEMKRQGVPGQFLWHVFSYELVRSARGVKAMCEDERVATKPAELFLISSDARHPAAGRAIGVAPTFHGDDILVAPTDLAWTMAFTHEEPELGPFFAWAGV